MSENRIGAVADTGLFVACGSLDNEKFKALRKDARQRGISFRLPKQRHIANSTDREEDTVEKANTALAGLAMQILKTWKADSVGVYSTDKPAGRAIVGMFEKYGYGDQVEFVYAFDYIDDLVS